MLSLPDSAWLASESEAAARPADFVSDGGPAKRWVLLRRAR